MDCDKWTVIKQNLPLKGPLQAGTAPQYKSLWADGFNEI